MFTIPTMSTFDFSAINAARSAAQSQLTVDCGSTYENIKKSAEVGLYIGVFVVTASVVTAVMRKGAEAVCGKSAE